MSITATLNLMLALYLITLVNKILTHYLVYELHIRWIKKIVNRILLIPLRLSVLALLLLYTFRFNFYVL